ncbi:undecaprenyl-diphosphatase [Priestia megaterium]|uniref:undecaprenyl-diphosphatase n=1 Tax=Priestia megaterium TaxID=1404 RepID=UPI002E249CBA|nr:undecaprenyl-diphosphatase [Priestia megaterium]
MNLNYEVFQWINSFAGKSSAMDSVMIIITNSVPYFIMACLLLLWFSGKTERTIYHRYTALYMLFTIVLSLCINEVIHLVYYHPRPFVTHHVHKLIPHPANSSFVSDHSILVFSAAWIMWLRKNKWRSIIFIWAVISGLSRIYVGVHYPADVLGGMMIAGAIGCFIIYVSAKTAPLIQRLFWIHDLIIKRIPFLSPYTHEQISKKNHSA